MRKEEGENIYDVNGDSKATGNVRVKKAREETKSREERKEKEDKDSECRRKQDSVQG